MPDLDRRAFLQHSAVAGAALLSHALPTRAEAPMTKRPNILFCIADDATHMSAYGNQWLSTPNFDRIAGEGVRFDNFFVTNPKCAPSRACTLTGMHTWQLGDACTHYCVWPRDLVVYPDLLDEAGYHVGFTGKPWAPGDWQRTGRTINPAGPAYNQHKLEPPAKFISACDYAANFDDFLGQRPADTPFCFWYGGMEPHRPYEEGVGVRHGKRLEDVVVPKYWPDTEVVRSDLLDYAYEIEWFDSHLGRMLASLEQAGELDNTIVVVTSDNGAPFPRVKGQIYEDDCNLPMAVRWGDHCPGGRIVEDFVSCIDFAPTFLEAAGVPAPEPMAGRSFVNLLSPKDSGHIDATRDAAFMGRERHDLGREGDLGYPVRAIRTHEWFYSRNFKPGRWPAGNPETGYTNIDSSPTKRLILELHEQGEDRWWQLAMGKRPAEELYDIQADPECLHNLAADPKYAKIKEQLWARLERVLRETGDPRIFGHGDVFDEAEYVNSDKAAHSWKAYVEGWFKGQRF